jgi:hypothetical protein
MMSAPGRADIMRYPWLIGSSFVVFVVLSSVAEHRSMVSKVNDLETRLGATESRLDPLPAKVQDLEAAQKAAGVQPDVIAKVSTDATASIPARSLQKPIIRTLKNVATPVKAGGIDGLLH